MVRLPHVRTLVHFINGYRPIALGRSIPIYENAKVKEKCIKTSRGAAGIDMLHTIHSFLPHSFAISPVTRTNAAT
jgi:hypothetical protein